MISVLQALDTGVAAPVAVPVPRQTGQPAAIGLNPENSIVALHGASLGAPEHERVPD